MDSVKFLISIWSKQARPGEYVFLCTRKIDGDNVEWKDHPILYRGRTHLKEDLKRFFKQYDSKKYDIYFAPLAFSKPRRAKEAAVRSIFLWQDLDYADPKKFPNKQELFPSIYWQSSPGRYHALWKLDKVYDLDEVTNLNRDLAYYVGADKGGWDKTQVLRVPGTHNLKYEDKPVVKLMKSNGKTYQLKTLRKLVPEKKELTTNITVSYLEEGDPQEILNRYSGKIPAKTLKLLLQQEVEVGKRSDVLWMLEHQLYEAGLTPEEIFTLVKHSAWNKYRGRKDENERLAKEIEKTINDFLSKSIEKPKELVLEGSPLKIETFGQVMANINSYPGWLVEGFWARRSHGIVAGEPKSFKSTFTLDLAVSVASGEPFLGKYPVLEPGPVIIVQNENADWIIKDKMEKLIYNRGLAGKVEYVNKRVLKVEFPKEIPLYMINQQGYSLDNPEHQQVMEALIKEIRPVLVIFDPLYLMFDGDINSAKDLNPVLNWMLKLKNEYKTGVMVIHHYNKGSGGNTHWRGGQRMLGSTTLHGWIESAWYLQVMEPDESQAVQVDQISKAPASVIMTREFRNAGHYPKIELKLRMGEFGDPTYEVTAEVYSEEGEGKSKRLNVDQVAVEIIRAIKTIKENRIISWTELMEMVGVDSQKLIKEAASLAAKTDTSLKITAAGVTKTKKKKIS